MVSTLLSLRDSKTYKRIVELIQQNSGSTGSRVGQVVDSGASSTVASSASAANSTNIIVGVVVGKLLVFQLVAHMSIAVAVLATLLVGTIALRQRFGRTPTH